jgi:hypothetical protein
MIRYISYIGPKDAKTITIANGRKVIFPKGEPLDVIEAGVEERKARHLLRTGLFKLHGEQSIPLELPEENQCTCGFIAKSKAGLASHRRKCKA